MSNATAVLAAARRYIDQEWKLLPTDTESKQPLGSLGLKHATSNIERIKTWLKRWPHLALAGTPPPGTTIVDVDAYKDPAALQPVVQELRKLKAPTQRSQSGGYHFLIAGPVPRARDLRLHFGTKHIDTRPHAKGYILLEPAPGYVWSRSFTGKPPQTPPAWINGYDVGAASTTLKQGIEFKDLQNWQQERKKVRGALAVLDADMPYDEWILVGQALHSIDPDPAGPAYSAWNEWSSAGAKYKNQSDLDAHWLSFSQGGGVKAGTLYDMATQEDATWRKKRTTRERSRTSSSGSKEADTAQRHSLGEIARTDKREIELYVDGLLSQGAYLMIAMYKFGKTFMALQLAAALATGKDFLGMKVVKKRKVALLALEEGGVDENQRPPSQRLASRVRKMGLEKDTDDVGVYFAIGDDPEAFMQTIFDENDVVIVDSLAKLKQLTQGEGGGGIWQSDYDIIDAFRGPAQRAGKLLLFLTHGSKLGNHVDPESAINSTGGTLAAADGFFVLQRPDKTDADRVRLTPLGRDASNAQLELRFHPLTLTWQSMGPWLHMSPTGAHIFNVLSEQQKHVALPYNEVATLAGTTGQVVMNECSQSLRRAGLIDVVGRHRNEQTRAYEGQARIKLSRLGWKRVETLQEFGHAKERALRQKEMENEFGKRKESALAELLK